MKYIKIVLVIIILCMMVSCGCKPRSWYSEGVIAVMAAPDDWEAFQGVLRINFERVVRTPHQEKTFTLRYVPDEDFVRYTKYRHLVLIATLQSTGRIGKLVDQMLSDPILRQKVENGENYYFPINNEWAKDQLMLVLVAKDIPSLRERLENSGNTIYEIFNMDLNKRLLKVMYQRREQKKVAERLMEHYGWSIRVQHDYFIDEEKPEDGFVFFRRIHPERWIFVRWLEDVQDADSLYMNTKWVVAERNRIGATYYGGDRVDHKHLFSFRSEFLQRPAQITTGIWKNDRMTKGGPFRSYTFFDQISNRLYMIDIAVCEPGNAKVPYLRRLDLIARTFHTFFERKN